MFKSRTSGFNIFELLSVIAVLSILSAACIFFVFDFRMRIKMAAAMNDFEAIASACRISSLLGLPVIIHDGRVNAKNSITAGQVNVISFLSSSLEDFPSEYVFKTEEKKVYILYDNGTGTAQTYDFGTGKTEIKRIIFEKK